LLLFLPVIIAILFHRVTLILISCVFFAFFVYVLAEDLGKRHQHAVERFGKPQPFDDQTWDILLSPRPTYDAQSDKHLLSTSAATAIRILARWCCSHPNRKLLPPSRRIAL